MRDHRTDPPAGDARGHPLSVLVAADCPAAAGTTAAVLALAGFDARVARGGPDALRMARADPPDAVVMDLWVDGWELARRLGTPPPRKRPFLVAVTGCSPGDEDGWSSEAGVDLHLAKPVEPGILVGVLRRFARVLAPAVTAGRRDAAGEAGREADWSIPLPVEPAAMRRRRLALLLGLVPLPGITQSEADWALRQRMRLGGDE